MQAFGGPSLEKVLDFVSPVDGRAVPDEDDLAGDLPQEDTQEAHHRCGVIGSRTYLHEQAPIQRDPADRRKMIVREFDPQQWRLSTWGPGAHGHRQEVKARFIYPDDGGFFLIGFFFISGQRSSDHFLMASSFRWLARSTGF